MIYRKIKAYIGFLLIGVLLTACASTSDYYRNLNSLVASRQYVQAAALTETKKMEVYGEKNALLYYLDRGMLLHYSGDYNASNEAFEKAKKLAEEYFTKSVTTEASTFLVSDNMRPYYGEDFERALINVFSALNYAYLGKESDALVEARQVDHFLKTLKVNYGHKNVYTDDAFVRYMTGMLFENQGQINDAYISYVQALDAYKGYNKSYAVATPLSVAMDAVRTARKLGMSEEAREIQNEYNVDFDGKALEGGEVVVVNYNGIVPQKIDSFFEMTFGEGWAYVEKSEAKGDDAAQVNKARSMARAISAKDQLRIAFPKYVNENYLVKSMEVKAVNSGNYAKSILVEDLGAIAIRGLEDRIFRVRAKAIARGVIKFVLAQQVGKSVEKSQGELVGWLAKTAMKTAASATESADKRSWRSLPDKINLARLQLPVGTHSVEVRFLDGNGNMVSSQTIDNIRIQKGKKTFVCVRSAV